MDFVRMRLPAALDTFLAILTFNKKVTSFNENMTLLKIGGR